MTVTVKHSKTNAISDWTQAQLDEQIALGNFAPGTTLANIVLPSDWNNDHTLTGIGTMAEQNANNVAITGGTINNASIGATTPSTGKFTSVTTPSVTASSTDLTLSAISTGAVKFNTLGGTQAQVIDTASVDSYVTLTGGVGSATVAAGSSTGAIDLRLDSRSSGNVRLRTAGGTEQARVSHTASAVNYVQVTGAATGQRPTISAQGSDTNIGLSFDVKGGPNIFFRSYGGVNNQLKISGTNASVNNHVISGGASTIAPSLSVEGTDTNISMAFQPKGTGAIDLAAGSSGVNLSNGGTVTALTLTNAGLGYTSFPTATISTPTTAGGVQAVASFTRMYPSGGSVTSGGTGYTVGDVLTLVGGTPVTTAATLTVSTVSAGVITGYTISAANSYTVLPSSPTSVTGGTGTGATFTLTYSIGAASTISNAGSGYIEQPTVSFSGGGGSGASAYATVGSVPIIRTLGTQLSFFTPSGEAFRLNDPANGTVVNYILAQGSVTNGGVQMRPSGSDTNTAFLVSSKGTSQVSFYTNTFGAEQFRAAHTASAVNYVQVTGAATTANPTLSVQGSDTNINMVFNAKGTGNIAFWSGAGSYRQFRISGANLSVNSLVVSGTTAGNAPSIASEGSDTNIDLALTPKGTGLVRFGTYTAGAPTATGYISIKAADGTTYKVLVST